MARAPPQADALAQLLLHVKSFASDGVLSEEQAALLSVLASQLVPSPSAAPPAHEASDAASDRAVYRVAASRVASTLLEKQSPEHAEDASSTRAVPRTARRRRRVWWQRMLGAGAAGSLPEEESDDGRSVHGEADGLETDGTSLASARATHAPMSATRVALGDDRITADGTTGVAGLNDDGDDNDDGGGGGSIVDRAGVRGYALDEARQANINLTALRATHGPHDDDVGAADVGPDGDGSVIGSGTGAALASSRVERRRGRRDDDTDIGHDGDGDAEGDVGSAVGATAAFASSSRSPSPGGGSIEPVSLGQLRRLRLDRRLSAPRGVGAGSALIDGLRGGRSSVAQSLSERGDSGSEEEDDDEAQRDAAATGSAGDFETGASTSAFNYEAGSGGDEGRADVGDADVTGPSLSFRDRVPDASGVSGTPAFDVESGAALPGSESAHFNDRLDFLGTALLAANTRRSLGRLRGGHSAAAEGADASSGSVVTAPLTGSAASVGTRDTSGQSGTLTSRRPAASPVAAAAGLGGAQRGGPGFKPHQQLQPLAQHHDGPEFAAQLQRRATHRPASPLQRFHLNSLSAASTASPRSGVASDGATGRPSVRGSASHAHHADDRGILDRHHHDAASNATTRSGGGAGDTFVKGVARDSPREFAITDDAHSATGDLFDKLSVGATSMSVGAAAAQLRSDHHHVAITAQYPDVGAPCPEPDAETLRAAAAAVTAVRNRALRARVRRHSLDSGRANAGILSVGLQSNVSSIRGGGDYNSVRGGAGMAGDDGRGVSDGDSDSARRQYDGDVRTAGDDVSSSLGELPDEIESSRIGSRLVAAADVATPTISTVITASATVCAPPAVGAPSQLTSSSHGELQAVHVARAPAEVPNVTAPVSLGRALPRSPVVAPPSRILQRRVPLTQHTHTASLQGDGRVGGDASESTLTRDTMAASLRGASGAAAEASGEATAPVGARSSSTGAVLGGAASRLYRWPPLQAPVNAAGNSSIAVVSPVAAPGPPASSAAPKTPTTLVGVDTTPTTVSHSNASVASTAAATLTVPAPRQPQPRVAIRPTTVSSRLPSMRSRLAATHPGPTAMAGMVLHPLDRSVLPRLTNALDDNLSSSPLGAPDLRGDSRVDAESVLGERQYHKIIGRGSTGAIAGTHRRSGGSSSVDEDGDGGDYYDGDEGYDDRDGDDDDYGVDIASDARQSAAASVASIGFDAWAIAAAARVEDEQQLLYRGRSANRQSQSDIDGIRSDSETLLSQLDTQNGLESIELADAPPPPHYRRAVTDLGAPSSPRGKAAVDAPYAVSFHEWAMTAAMRRSAASAASNRPKAHTSPLWTSEPDFGNSGLIDANSNVKDTAAGYDKERHASLVLDGDVAAHSDAVFPLPSLRRRSAAMEELRELLDAATSGRIGRRELLDGVIALEQEIDAINRLERELERQTLQRRELGLDGRDRLRILYAADMRRSRGSGNVPLVSHSASGNIYEGAHDGSHWRMDRPAMHSPPSVVAAALAVGNAWTSSEEPSAASDSIADIHDENVHHRVHRSGNQVVGRFRGSRLSQQAAPAEQWDAEVHSGGGNYRKSRRDASTKSGWVAEAQSLWQAQRSEHALQARSASLTPHDTISANESDTADTGTFAVRTHRMAVHNADSPRNSRRQAHRPGTWAMADLPQPHSSTQRH